VSLAHLADPDEIVIKAHALPEIVFSRKRDFYKQVAQLDYVIERVQEAGAGLETAPALQSVNLSFEGPVIARLQAATAGEPAARANLSFPLQPSQRKPKRELQ
jgi:hypothetical protein